MTCIEKLKQDRPELVGEDCNDEHTIWIACPHQAGYLARPDWCPGICGSKECRACWNREIPNSESTKESPTPPTVLYRCDRRACEKCSFPECQHTPDISHAVDFHKIKDGTYVED